MGRYEMVRKKDIKHFRDYEEIIAMLNSMENKAENFCF